MNKYYFNVVLERIKIDLEIFFRGIILIINSCEYNIVGWCYCFVGDILVVNEFGGYKIGVGFVY